MNLEALVKMEILAICMEVVAVMVEMATLVTGMKVEAAMVERWR